MAEEVAELAVENAVPERICTTITVRMAGRVHNRYLRTLIELPLTGTAAAPIVIAIDDQAWRRNQRYEIPTCG